MLVIRNFSGLNILTRKCKCANWPAFVILYISYMVLAFDSQGHKYVHWNLFEKRVISKKSYPQSNSQSHQQTKECLSIKCFFYEAPHVFIYGLRFLKKLNILSDKDHNFSRYITFDSYKVDQHNNKLKRAANKISLFRNTLQFGIVRCHGIWKKEKTLK